MTLTGEIRRQSLKNNYIDTISRYGIFLIFSITSNKRRGLIYITIIVYLSIYQFIRHLQSFGSGRQSRRSLMARRRPRVNQESLPQASLAGWRSGRFFRQGLDCWLGPTCRSRPPNRGREP